MFDMFDMFDFLMKYQYFILSSFFLWKGEGSARAVFEPIRTFFYGNQKSKKFEPIGRKFIYLKEFFSPRTIKIKKLLNDFSEDKKII